MLSKRNNSYSLIIAILLVFGLSLVRQFINGQDFMLWMMDFMGWFFIIFGLCKLIDITGFVKGFQTYDLVAKKFPHIGYIYPFIEIGLGIMYLIGLMFTWQLVLSLLLSGLGVASAMQALKNKQEIKCVCLGTKFDLPMTKLTLIENVFMFLMTLFMFTM